MGNDLTSRQATDNTPLFSETVLTDADVDGAEVLVAEAGWNQTAADWRIFFGLGNVFGVRALDGGLAGTAAILPYAGGFGWISMILVATEWRRRGIASRLLERCMNSLSSRNLVPALDATPAGREVYGRYGFRDCWTFARWRGQPPSTRDDLIDGVRKLEDRGWPSIVALDAACFGCDRSPLLEGLRDRSRAFAGVAESNGRLAGFLLGREGRLAVQLGPIVADDESTAIQLMNFAGQRAEQAVLLDVPDRHARFARRLARQGFARERSFTRMVFDRNESFGDALQLYAIAGPEFG
jgi:GNAT superfamily N-acetyltransferase